MQQYEVIILPLAEKDIQSNTDYIAVQKQAPETALKLARGFREKIEGLSFMPESHELDEDEELAGRGIRKCYYKIFFFVNESEGTVYVLRILHLLVDAKPRLLNLPF